MSNEYNIIAKYGIFVVGLFLGIIQYFIKRYLKTIEDNFKDLEKKFNDHIKDDNDNCKELVSKYENIINHIKNEIKEIEISNAELKQAVKLRKNIREDD